MWRCNSRARNFCSKCGKLLKTQDMSMCTCCRSFVCDSCSAVIVYLPLHRWLWGNITIQSLVSVLGILTTAVVFLSVPETSSAGHSISFLCVEFLCLREIAFRCGLVPAIASGLTILFLAWDVLGLAPVYDDHMTVIYFAVVLITTVAIILAPFRRGVTICV